MLKKTLSTILIVTAAVLATPAAVHAQGTPVAQSKKATAAKVVKSGRIDVDGIQYYYQIRGQGAPLLLLHGGLGSVDMFAPIMPALAAKRQIIGVDLQGHGRTPLGSRPISMAAMGADMAAILKKLGYGPVDDGLFDGGRRCVSISSAKPAAGAAPGAGLRQFREGWLLSGND